MVPIAISWLMSGNETLAPVSVLYLTIETIILANAYEPICYYMETRRRGNVPRPPYVRAPKRSSETGDSDQSCRDFVQRFYDWYFLKALDLHAGRPEDLALRYRSAEFSSELVRELREDFKAQDEDPGEIVGLDFDPFLASQDRSEHVVVARVRHKNGSYLVQVYGMSAGTRSERVVPELVRQNGQWVFVNFHYPDVDHDPAKNGDLLSILKSLREDRQKVAK
jgi:hypothetical protein